MGVKEYHRHSRKVIRDKRWPALRLAAKRRDGFKCVKCGARGRLEVDHIKPVRTHPELSFDLDNLQTLCSPHHSSKTKSECGFGAEVSPARKQWLALVDAISRQSTKELLNARKRKD